MGPSHGGGPRQPPIDLPDLAALPFAEAEAEAVGSLLGTAVYTGAQASELQLRGS